MIILVTVGLVMAIMQEMIYYFYNSQARKGDGEWKYVL